MDVSRSSIITPTYAGGNPDLIVLHKVTRAISYRETPESFFYRSDAISLCFR